VLECLKLHLWDRFELGDFFLDGGEPGNLVLGGSGEADITAGGLKFLQHADEAVLVDLGQLDEMVVRGISASSACSLAKSWKPTETCSQPSSVAASRRPVAARDE
jgi:hypothetical protein